MCVALHSPDQVTWPHPCSAILLRCIFWRFSKCFVFFFSPPLCVIGAAVSGPWCHVWEEGDTSGTCDWPRWWWRQLLCHWAVSSCAFEMWSLFLFSSLEMAGTVSERNWLFEVIAFSFDLSIFPFRPTLTFGSFSQGQSNLTEVDISNLLGFNTFCVVAWKLKYHFLWGMAAAWVCLWFVQFSFCTHQHMHSLKPNICLLEKLRGEKRGL